MGLSSEAVPFARLTAGIMVKKGNPKAIESLSDLAEPDVRVAIAEKSAAIGKITHEVLSEAGILERIREGDFITTTTVNAVANTVKLNSVDAGVVWGSLMVQYPDHDFIEIAEFNAKSKSAVIALMQSSENARLARQFMRYLCSREKGGKVLRKHGFNVDLMDE